MGINNWRSKRREKSSSAFPSAHPTPSAGLQKHTGSFGSSPSCWALVGADRARLGSELRPSSPGLRRQGGSSPRPPPRREHRRRRWESARAGGQRTSQPLPSAFATPRESPGVMQTKGSAPAPGHAPTWVSTQRRHRAHARAGQHDASPRRRRERCVPTAPGTAEQRQRAPRSYFNLRREHWQPWPFPRRQRRKNISPPLQK